MTARESRSLQKVRRLQEVLAGKRSLLILMQDNPDPDSIAAAAALRRIANTAGDVSCSIAYGGKVGRGENRAVMDYLGLNFRPVDQVDPARFDALALVDTQPRTGNNSLPEDLLPDIVIDHHPLRPETRKVAFTDVRSRYGAAATILYEYLRALDITPGVPLATALLYAIRSDTQDLGAEAIEADRRAAQALLLLANTRMLSAIQRGSVDSGYFRMLARALDNARVYGLAIVTDLEDIDTADILGETADLLLRHERARWTLCLGVHDGVLWLSMRTAQNVLEASKVMRGIVKGLGTGGGHETSAGGQLPLDRGTRDERTRLARTVRERFLDAVGLAAERPRRLLSSRDRKAEA